MKKLIYISLFFLLAFFLTLTAAFSIPSIQSAMTKNLLLYLKDSYGLEVNGGAKWTLFPFQLHLNKVHFEDLHADSVDIGLGSFTIKQLEEVDLSGTFWFDLQLKPYGKLSGSHQKYGDASLSFSIKQKGKRDELLLETSASGPFGNIQGEGSLVLPKRGLIRSIEEGRSLICLWKVKWNEEQIGSAVGYLTIGFENRRFTLPSIEAAGTLFGERFTLDGSGELEHPLIDFHLEPAHFSIGDFPLKSGKLDLSVYRHSKKWEGTLSLEGMIEDRTLKVSSLLELKEGESFSLKEGVISFEGGAGSFEGKLLLNERLFVAALTLATDSVFPFIEADGDLLIKASLSTLVDESYFPFDPDLTLELFSHRLEKGPFTLIDGQTYLKLVEERGIPSWKIKGDVDQFLVSGETFENILLATEGKTGELSPITLSFSEGGSPLVMRGDFSPSVDGIRLFFQSIEGDLFQLPLSLEQTAFLSFYPDGWHLDRFHLNFGKSSLRLDGRGGAGEVALQGELQSLYLDELNPTLKGVGRGTLEIFGPWDDLEGLVSLQLKEFEIENELPHLFPIIGDLSVRFSNHQALLKGKFEGAQGELMEGDGRLFFTEFYPLNGRLSFKGELSPFLSYLLPDTTSVSGDGEGEIVVQGTLQNPKASGKVRLFNGTYEDLMTGMLYREMEATFLLQEDVVLIEGLRAFDRFRGEITGSGKLQLDKEGLLPFYIDIESRAGELVNLDYVTARASGKVTLSGNKEKGLFKGDLRVDDMVVRLPEKTPILLQKLDIVYEKIKPEEVKEPWGLSWDLNIDLQNVVRVDGSVFNSRWGGDLQLKGTTDAPLLFGKGKLVQANFNFNGKTFESKDGMILFQGEPGTKSSFYITAKEEIEDLKIEIILKGPIKSPELTFRSNPPKSSKEILSYLLFNRGTGDSSPYEGGDLAQSIIKLDGTQTSSELGFLDKLKSGLGIDRIEISGDNDQDPQSVSLEVGKYISPSLYFCLKKSVSDGPNQAAIVAKLPHHFKAQGEMGDDAEGKFMLKWEKDY